MSTCRGVREDGCAYSVRPMIGTDWCINHSPDAEVIKLRDNARRNGGHARGQQLRREVERPPMPDEPPWWSLTDLEHARDAFRWCVQGLVKGSVDARTANALTSALHGFVEVTRGLQVDARESSLEVARGRRR